MEVTGGVRMTRSAIVPRMPARMMRGFLLIFIAYPQFREDMRLDRNLIS
jgi:hypothetical protein